MFGTTKTKPTIPQPGELTWGFRLGDRVRDTINGIEGVATARVFHLSGCDRFSIELDAKDGEVKYYHTDGNRLELVQAFPDRHRDELPDGRIKLGDKAKCTVSGIAGSVTIINIPLIGAIQICIQPDYSAKTNTMPEGYFVDEHLVEVTTPYTPAVAAPAPVVAEPEPVKKPQRGSMRLGRGMTC